jgi:uncharacterized membrane protein YdjX (TVP38/TMEM64 family)
MNYKKVAVVVSMILIFIGVRYFEVDNILSIEILIENKDRLIVFTSNHIIASVLIFMIGNIVLGALGVPVFAVFTLAAGLIFGFLEGMMLSLSASLMGGYISFYFSRYAFSNYFRKKYGHRLKKVESKLEANGFKYLLGLRLLPGFPYFVTNIIAGLSPIKESTFLYSTILGIIPSTTLFIYTGHVLRKVDSVYKMFSLEYMWPIVAIVLLVVVAILLKLRKDKAI